MAKKSKAAKPKGGARKKAGARTQSKREVSRVRRPPTRPKSRPLPGMEDLAESKALDKICDSLADVRHQVNELKRQDSGLLSNAAQVMQREGRGIYRAHGVELVLKKGDVKVTARLTKSDGTAEDAVDDDGPEIEIEPDEDTASDGTEATL